jgi:hypothetical protein
MEMQGGCLGMKTDYAGRFSLPGNLLVNGDAERLPGHEN